MSSKLYFLTNSLNGKRSSKLHDMHIDSACIYSLSRNLSHKSEIPIDV